MRDHLRRFLGYSIRLQSRDQDTNVQATETSVETGGGDCTIISKNALDTDLILVVHVQIAVLQSARPNADELPCPDDRVVRSAEDKVCHLLIVSCKTDRTSVWIVYKTRPLDESICNADVNVVTND